MTKMSLMWVEVNYQRCTAGKYDKYNNGLIDCTFDNGKSKHTKPSPMVPARAAALSETKKNVIF